MQTIFFSSGGLPVFFFVIVFQGSSRGREGASGLVALIAGKRREGSCFMGGREGGSSTIMLLSLLP